jgi:hypothetical protein
MRKLIFGTLGLLMTLAAFVSVPQPAQAQVCPLCIIGYHCCIQGQNAQCLPDSTPCS